jgi:hypothetical protein
MMKKNGSLARILLLAVSVSIAGVFGCDDKNDDTKANAMSLALLGIANSITVISPSNGNTNVYFGDPFKIRFPVTLGPDMGTVTLTYNTGTVTLDSGNSVINISDNIVTIDPGILSTSTKYWNIVISGFKDQNGNLIPAYTDAHYSFTTNSTCFVAGTLVSTTDGMKAIETIAAGDMVYAYDFDSDTVVEAAVDKVFTATDSQIYRISVGSELIGVTSPHPFYVKGRGWVKAKDLSVGDALVTRGGATVVINSIAVENVTVPVYNIEVDGMHNYFVTEVEFLVHNY